MGHLLRDLSEIEARKTGRAVRFALAAAGLSSLLVLLIVNVFPARRVAEVPGFLGAVFPFICSQSGQFARFEDVSQDQAAQLVALVTRLNTPWSPLTRAGRGLVDLGEGHWLASAGFLAITLGLSALVFGAALTTAEKLYYTGWANIQRKTSKKKIRPTRRGSVRQQQVTRFFEARVPAAIRAILIKDYYVLRRDRRNMSQLVTPIILGLSMLIVGSQWGRNLLRQRRGTRNFQPDHVQCFALLEYWNLAICELDADTPPGRHWIFSGGQKLLDIETAPVKASTLLAAKFFVAFLPATLFAWLFLLVMVVVCVNGLGSLWFSMPVAALNIAGNTGLNLMFGVLGANMGWDDPRHMMRGSVGCLGSLASFFYFPISLLFFFGPLLGLGLIDVLAVAG